MIDEDITRAETLPAEMYRDPALLARQRDRLFARSWQLCDLAEPPAGTAVPFTFLPGCVDEPLLRTREAVLSNVCTHRGNLVCTEATSGPTLRCRYHGRRFALDGKLVSMPEFEGVHGFPSAADDLPRLPLERLGPLAFTALDPAFSFADWTAPVRERIDWLDRLQPDAAGSRDYSVAAHWALYCDNYLEGFHIPFVHPALAKQVDMDSYTTQLLPWGTLQMAEGEDSFPGTRVAAWYFFLFPNLMLNFYPWGLSLNLVVPLATDRTRVVYRTFVADPSRLGRGAGGALDRVEQEDEAIVEQVQRGMQSRLYRRGRYSPTRETGVHHFHRLLVAQLA